jgi:hypothetical protein
MRYVGYFTEWKTVAISQYTHTVNCVKEHDSCFICWGDKESIHLFGVSDSQDDDNNNIAFF